eukprot:TRINITY_DN2209_c0_g2_i1.p1 TRINITY_DN2209_c0_g2~~TRINITY_DN2209_c0_g2_i1.p1  ORF type:complete len:269 (+),score=85.36 TRINITY_DN2209_c0_g2_i1:281-1087(+)
MLEKSNKTPRHKYSAIKARYFSALNLINSQPKNQKNTNKNELTKKSSDSQEMNKKERIQKRHTVSNPVISNSHRENHVSKNNKKKDQTSPFERKAKKSNNNSNNDQREHDLYNNSNNSNNDDKEEEEEETLVISKSNLGKSSQEEEKPIKVSSPIVIKNANKSKLTAALLQSPREDPNNSFSQEQVNNDEDIFNSQVTTDFINTAYSCPLINTSNSDSMYSNSKSFLEVVKDEDDEDFGEFIPPHLLANRNTFSFYQHRRNVKYMTNI